MECIILSKNTNIGLIKHLKYADEQDISSGFILDVVIESLQADKANDIIHIELTENLSIADYMVVASAGSSRQVIAIANKLQQRIKDKIGFIVKMEGHNAGDWILIDAGDVIIHIFRPEVRDFYQLEKMWQNSHHYTDKRRHDSE